MPHSFLANHMDREPRLREIREVRLFKTETLGTGSYGVVCKAMCNQRPCAAKLLHPIFFQSNDPGIVTTRTRFEQECHFLSEMKHPNVVEYLGASHDPDSGLLVLLMELLDESLTHFLERSQQPLAYHIEVDLCHDIAQALAYIHSNGILHRDLSSNNVLLSTSGKAKITDFGMSKLLDINQSMKPLTMCPGTMVYMSPEALLDHPVYSNKIDCFSFGVLEIQMMTRQFPDPGHAIKAVDDSTSPVGRVHIPILESERRKAHIDLIDPTHALLPTALSCLSYSEDNRPSAQELCQQLATVKGTPRYTQSAQQDQNIRELQQQLEAGDKRIHSLEQQLQTKDQQLQDSQRQMYTLQQELQGSREQNQQLTRQVEEEQHTIEDREQQLRQLIQQSRTSEEITAQNEQTIRELRHTIDQLQQKQQHQAMKEKQRATESSEGRQPNKQQIQTNKPAVTLEPEQNLAQQETVPTMSWKQSKAPDTMRKGSVAIDANMTYCNDRGSTAVHAYDSEKEEWTRVPDCGYPYSCLVTARGMLTAVGGWPPTNSLLSLTGEGGDRKWSRLFPVMPTKRYNTAAVCSGHSLIVAGGDTCINMLTTVEVLDTDTQQWATASSLPHPYSSATLGICGSRLCMLGGRDRHDLTRSVLSCSIPELLQSCQTQSLAGKLRTLARRKNQVWRSVADAPHKASTCSALCGRLVAVGGFDGTVKDTTAISAYNERTDSWKTMANMPTARRHALVAVISGKMIVVGGEIGGGWTDAVEIGTAL